jgi:hypothetical protein
MKKDWLGYLQKSYLAKSSSLLVIKDKIKDKNCKLTVQKLCLLVRYKQTKEDGTISSMKADLLAQWNKMKHHSSPYSSPNNSNDEERGGVGE